MILWAMVGVVGFWMGATPVDAARAHREAFEQERALAEKAPLEVLDGRLLREPAAGLGIYSEVRGGRVAGPEIFLYAHVRNHLSRRVRRGYQLHLVTDLIVLDEAGGVLATDRGFGVSRYTSRTEHRDTFVNIGVKSAGLPPGNYTMRLVIHDRIGGKVGEVEIPVVMPVKPAGGRGTR